MMISSEQHRNGRINAVMQRLSIRRSKIMRGVLRRSLIILQARSAKQGHKSKEENRKKKHAQKVAEHELAIANWEEKPKKERGPKPRPPSKFKEHKFSAPPKPKEISHPGKYQNPKKPVKPKYPDKPAMRNKTWRRLPVNRPKVRQMRQNHNWVDSVWDWKEKKRSTTS